MLISSILLFFSCKKNANDAATKLMRTEFVENSGNMLHTEYKYDNEDRIIEMRQFGSNADSFDAITISYDANIITLLSHPQTEPLYNQTEEVHLTLDGDGRLLKRIEYFHGVPKNPADPTETFRFDTLLCSYDADGLLKNTDGAMYDSIYLDPTSNYVSRFHSVANYTNQGGNLISSDENVVYPRIYRHGGITDTSGGSSSYHNDFSYAKSFPNHADFKNAAVLNEYKLYYDSPLNIKYSNMPDQVIMNTVDKDRFGAIIFSSSSTIYILRTYEAGGLISNIRIPTVNTPYKEIRFFYGR